MQNDPHFYSYPSRRTVMYGSRGMAATSTPQASEAGLEILKKGGNAIDAVLAMAMCLPVVEPTANGIGGDAFAIIYYQGKLYGLNSSGFSPARMTREELVKRGYDKMPLHGIEPVTVPGAPAAWAALSERFGKLPLTEICEPAARYADEGFPVSVTNSRAWKRGAGIFGEKAKTDMRFSSWMSTFTNDGTAPDPGGLWHYKHMGATLREIAKTNARSFYEGDLADKIVAFSDKCGGFLAKEDLAAYKPEWVDLVTTNYRGYDVYEIPPNGQGITALMALNIFENFEPDIGRETVRNYHLQLEAMKLAFADVKKHVADPAHMRVTFEELLSKDYAKERSRLIDPKKAGLFESGIYDRNGTVYLCAADGEGNMISYIQSNYNGFGSGMVVPGTDISLHNRGNNFTLEEGHANVAGPRKKPYHTIIPGFLMKQGKPIGPFGVMGGFMQPQGHMQVVLNTVDFGLNPQQALDAPRWQWIGDKQIELESTVNPAIVQALADLGHDVKLIFNYGSMGRGQIIQRLDNGVLAGGTEPRTDGTIAIW